MEENLREQISLWNDEGMYDKVIEAVGGIPESELDYAALLGLALAYNNTDRLQDSIDLLMKMRSTGEDDAVWNFYLGYALLFSGRRQEARMHMLRARELDPRVPAEKFLHYCICYDGGQDEKIDNTSVNRWICEMLDGTQEDDASYVPDVGVRILADAGFKTNGYCSATLDIDISLQSGESFYECCVGVGKDARDAVCPALGSFYLGFYTGMRRMLSGQPFAEITDQRSRIWKVFSSEVVGMGEHPKVPEIFYWELLKRAVSDHLGNRKIAYMKVYGAKRGDSVTAECRVDDTVSQGLGELLRSSVSGWESEGFASHKQFFFMMYGEDETYPYSQEQINGYVKAAMEILSDQNKKYEERFSALVDLTGDAYLADELRGFIPELCAERAFEKLTSADRLTISAGGGSKEYTKWQITSYNMIGKALDIWIHSNIYSELAFRECVIASSTYGVILKAKEDGSDMAERGGMIRHYYNFHEGYIAR